MRLCHHGWDIDVTACVRCADDVAYTDTIVKLTSERDDARTKLRKMTLDRNAAVGKLFDVGPYGDTYEKKLIWDGDEPVTQVRYDALVAEVTRLGGCWRWCKP